MGDFNGVKAVNREEACLYAFNTLKATMVEYDQRDSIVIVGNITIKDQSRSPRRWPTPASTDDNIDKDDSKMQFAEKYFTNLEKESPLLTISAVPLTSGPTRTPTSAPMWTTA